MSSTRALSILSHVTPGEQCLHPRTPHVNRSGDDHPIRSGSGSALSAQAQRSRSGFGAVAIRTWLTRVLLIASTTLKLKILTDQLAARIVQAV